MTATPIVLGDLLKELRAIVWRYVGADISGLIRVYQEYKLDPKKFRCSKGRKPVFWQKIANDCAAFYPQGYEWMLSLQQPPKVNWTLAMCHAIRRGNTEFATVERLKTHAAPLRAIDALDRKEFDLPDKKSISAYDAYAIAAIDSGRQALAFIMQHGMLNFQRTSSVAVIHLFGKEMLGLSLRDLFPFSMPVHLVRMFHQYIKQACRYANAGAMRFLLQNALSFHAVPPNPTLLIPLIWDRKKFAVEASEVLYQWMLANGYSLLFIMQNQLHRWQHPPMNSPEFITFAIKKEGNSIIQAIGDQHLAEHPEVLWWAGNIIENDDMFWTELGL